MGDHLLAFKSFLIGHINNITSSNVSEKIFFGPLCFFSLFLFDNIFNVMSEGTWFIHGWYEFGKNDVGIIPLLLSGFTWFVIEFFSWDPFLVVSCFVESWTFRGIPNDVGLRKSQRERSADARDPPLHSVINYYN